MYVATHHSCLLLAINIANDGLAYPWHAGQKYFSHMHHNTELETAINSKSKLVIQELHAAVVWIGVLK